MPKPNCVGRDDVKCSWESETIDQYGFSSESNDNNYRVIGVHGNSILVREELLFFCLLLTMSMPWPKWTPMGEHRVLNTNKTIACLGLLFDFKSTQTPQKCTDVLMADDISGFAI